MCLNLDVPPSQGNETSGCRPCGRLFHTTRRLTNHYNTPPPAVSQRSVRTLSNPTSRPSNSGLMFYPPNTTKQAGAVPVFAFPPQEAPDEPLQHTPTCVIPEIERNLNKPTGSQPTNQSARRSTFPSQRNECVLSLWSSIHTQRRLTTVTAHPSRP